MEIDEDYIYPTTNSTLQEKIQSVDNCINKVVASSTASFSFIKVTSTSDMHISTGTIFSASEDIVTYDSRMGAQEDFFRLQVESA